MEAQCDSSANALIRGANIGLTEAFQTYLDRYFEARRKNGGQACKGEDICSKIGAPDGNPGIRQMSKSADIEAACEKCPFIKTKPGMVPINIAPLLSAANRMEALFEGGAGVSYPALFTPLEWEAFLTLKYARAKDSERDLPKPGKQQSHGSAQAALEARLKRG